MVKVASQSPQSHADWGSSSSSGRLLIGVI